MFTHIYNCLLVLVEFSFSIFTCFHLCLPGLLLFTCLLVFAYVYHAFLPMFTPVFLCLPMFKLLNLFLPLFTRVYLCLALFTRVYQCLLVLTYVYHYLLVHDYLCLPLYTRVYKVYVYIKVIYFRLALWYSSSPWSGNNSSLTSSVTQIQQCHLHCLLWKLQPCHFRC